MFGAPPAAIANTKRGVMREVALTYRGVGRAAKAEGCSPPEYEHQAVNAAIAAYRQLDHDAPQDRLEASRIALAMIAKCQIRR
jgi:hypothetical protein